MLDPATFSVFEPLRNGGQVEIRALSSDDRESLLRAVGHTSDQSLYRRFFGFKKEFTDTEVSAFVNIDFKREVALVAVSHENQREQIVGGGRYVIARPGAAEIAFTVVDEFQGQGIAGALLRHLAALARAAGLTAFLAEVLPENTAMLRVLERSGLKLRQKRDFDVVHVMLELGQPRVVT